MRRTLGIMLTGAIVAGLGAVAVTSASAERPMALPRPMRVSEALRHLGDRADAVAQGKGSSVAHWRKESADDTAWVDRGGAMFFVEPQAATGATGEALIAEAAAPYSQTFLLHSNPTATRKVYLDFNGHSVTGTGWNASYTAGAAFTAASFNTDLYPTTFSNAEMDIVQAVWEQVAEDFAPYNIDVTTEDPGTAGINRASTSDLAYGTRVVITTTSTIYSTCLCGGLAYTGAISQLGTNHDYYQPAFVFTKGFNPISAKGLAEAASHEAGHTMGLSHDGSPSATYYAGHDSWAPIMGVGYNRPITQWSKGEYPGANQLQDDLAVMSTYTIPLRTDDFGSVAAPSPAGDSPISIAGVIGSRTDQDAFSFTTTGGTATFTASPAAVGANLDIKLDIVNAAGVVVASNDPAPVMVSATVATGLGATVTATLEAGTYRVVVDGVGYTSATSTVYSDYASIGQYSLTGTYATGSAPVNQLPIAAAAATPTTGTAPLAVTWSAAASSDPDGSIVSYSWAFHDGTTASTATASKTYSSAGTFNATLSVTDNSGGTTVTSAMITVNARPTATASVNPSSGVAPLAVVFSSGGSVDPDGAITAYNWAFSDGTTSTAQNPSKTFTTAGTYTATLTVTDNAGAVSGSATTSVVVTAPAQTNVAPFVSASATPTTGTAPLAVNFSSTGSSDPDGSIVAYSWAFGDGTTSTAANPSKVYSSAGTFAATLRVTDNAGAVSPITSLTITVTAPVVSKTVKVQTMTMTIVTVSGKKEARTVVKVTDQAGAVVSGVTVKGSYTGLGAVSRTATTGTSGTVTLKSAQVSNSAGTFVFTITSLAKSGYTYSSANNLVSTASLAY